MRPGSYSLALTVSIAFDASTVASIAFVTSASAASKADARSWGLTTGMYEYGDLLIAPGKALPEVRSGPRTWDYSYDDEYTVPPHVMRCHGMVVSSDYARHGRATVTEARTFAPRVRGVSRNCK